MIVILLFGASVLSAQSSARTEILASVVCPVNKIPRLFVLTKEEIASPILSKKLHISQVDHLIYLRLTRYNLLADLSSIKPDEIVWQDSVYTVGPGLGWAFDLEFDPISAKLFLVFFSQSSPKLAMWAYEIDPAGISRARLGGFGPHGYAQPVPEADKEKRLSDLFVKEYKVFGVNCLPEDHISSIIEDNSILVSVNQTLEEDCPPLYFRFDFKTKKWNEASIQE